ncbi:MAG TPA: TraR/DksA C4-type zinc finger protein [SAR324 cluster bacterium]|nr:TraR/DksA C4-type zinc finger protein [SAR324 cluster bacterium]
MAKLIDTLHAYAETLQKHQLPMTPERIAFFRERLEVLHDEVKADLAANMNDSEIVELDSSIGRLSRMDAMQNQQMALELRRRKENQLLRIKNAFKRMDKSEYGKCIKCAKQIDDDRLEVFPDALKCVSCA